MALKADTTALVSFKDIGQSKFLEGEGLGSFLSIAYKRTVNGVTYTFRTTDTTYKRLRALNGASLFVSRPFGPVTAKGCLELGAVKRLGAELNGKLNFQKGRALELKALWSEKTGATTFTLTGQPHSSIKVKSTVNSKNQAVTSDADIKFGGFTLSPAVKWQTGEKGVALAHKFQAGTLKGSYAIDRKIAGLEYNVKPYKINLISSVSGAKAYKPTLTLSFDKEFDLSSVRRPGRSASSKGGVPEVRRDVPLDAKLKELDAVYEPRIKKVKAKKAAHK